MPPKGKTPERVWARTTVSMAGAPRGRRVLVDPTDPDIEALINGEALVLEKEEENDAD